MFFLKGRVARRRFGNSRKTFVFDVRKLEASSQGLSDAIRFLFLFRRAGQAKQLGEENFNDSSIKRKIESREKNLIALKIDYKYLALLFSFS